MEIMLSSGHTVLADDADRDLLSGFTRKQDAESVIEYYGWTRAKAIEHCWPEPVEREVIAESNGHHWIRAFNLVCCRDCGIVRRADDQNKPCKGLVHVGPRTTDAPAHPVPTSHLEKAQTDNLRKPHHR